MRTLAVFLPFASAFDWVVMKVVWTAAHKSPPFLANDKALAGKWMRMISVVRRATLKLQTWGGGGKGGYRGKRGRK